MFLGLSITAAALLVAVLVAPGASRAAAPIEFTSVTLKETAASGDIDVASSAYTAVVTALQSAEEGGTASLATAVPGLPDITMTGADPNFVAAKADGSEYTITINHSAQVTFGDSGAVNVDVEFTADWADPDTDTAPARGISLTLAGSVALGDLLAPLGLADSLSGISEASILHPFPTDADATASVEVDSTGAATYAAEGGVSFGLGPGAGGCPSPTDPALCLSVSALLSREDGQVLLAFKPEASTGDLKLSDLLGPVLPAGVLVPEEIDPVIFGSSKPLAFVFSSRFFNMQALTDAQASFLDGFRIDGAFPYLIIGDAVNDTGGFSVFGRFPLPGANEPPPHDSGTLAAAVSKLGFSPNVLMTAGMPLLNPGAFKFSLGLVADQENVPPWMLAEETGMALEATVKVSPPSFGIGLAGTLGVKFKSGLPQDVADQLNNLGIPVYAAVSTGTEGELTCPEGSVAMQNNPPVDSTWSCYDRLKGTVSGSITATSVPPSLTVALS